jgi:hypothetical protein
MKKISILMIYISVHTLNGMSMSSKDQVKHIINVYEPAKMHVCNISKQLLNPRKDRLAVFKKLTQQHDTSITIVDDSQVRLISLQKEWLSKEISKKPDLYVIPAKRSHLQKNPIEDRRKNVLSFLALSNSIIKRSFKDGHTLHNNKGIITETRKQGVRLFYGKDVSDVIVNDDLTINIILKRDVF